MVLFFETENTYFPFVLVLMKAYWHFARIMLPILAGVVLFATCDRPEEPSLEALREEGARFRNVGDSAQYVGIQACQPCHNDIYNSFLQTGMGRSMGLADLNRSKADFAAHTTVFDPHLQLGYQAFVEDSQLYIKEFRMNGLDTLHSRIEKISMVVGSGQHTNSHLLNINGYVYQLPMTYYTQEGKWDLPPGFENGGNSRFSRTIEAECMTCHNAYPKPFPGAENKYISLPQGIDCERCHGPGSLHIAEKQAGIIVDTHKDIDLSIVNPRHLSVPLQMSICQRCHTQGNAVLKPGKTFFDFKPGMLLSDVMSVFLPRYEGDQGSFTMASHPDRLMQSACFQNSNNQLSCISCHNPHKSIEVTPAAHFNGKCQQCHQGGKQQLCSADETIRKTKNDNCVACHMPKSGTSDIPHVTITDHWIRKPASTSAGTRTFVGIASINEKRPDALTKAKAWLQYYERFDAKSIYLDSAFYFLEKVNNQPAALVFETRIHALFLQQRYPAIVALAESAPANIDAWTQYRLGEAFAQTGALNQALEWIEKACKQKPYQLDFQFKYASLLHDKGDRTLAAARYRFILSEQPQYVPAMINLGFLLLEQGDDQTAEKWYKKALKLDPDNQSAWMNLVGLHLYRQQNEQAKKLLDEIIRRYPSQQQARILRERLNA